MADEFCCTFCGRSQHEVETLIAGPAVFICDECVELCVQVIAWRRAEEEKKVSSDVNAAMKQQEPADG